MYFWGMDNDFLHKINLDALSKETRLSEEEIAKLAGISDPKNLGKWGQGKPNGSRPNYNAFVRLLQNGATVETLFGVEYKGRSVSAEVSENPDFQAGVVKALAGMNFRGIIREEVEQAIAEMKAKGKL